MKRKTTRVYTHSPLRLLRLTTTTTTTTILFFFSFLSFFSQQDGFAIPDSLQFHDLENYMCSDLDGRRSLSCLMVPSNPIPPQDQEPPPPSTYITSQESTDTCTQLSSVQYVCTGTCGRHYHMSMMPQILINKPPSAYTFSPQPAMACWYVPSSVAVIVIIIITIIIIVFFFLFLPPDWKAEKWAVSLSAVKS